MHAAEPTVACGLDAVEGWLCGVVSGAEVGAVRAVDLGDDPAFGERIQGGLEC